MKWTAIVAACGVALLLGSACAYSWWVNPRVADELRNEPDGERAQKVMLLTLPSGKELPVNYLRDGNVVYCAADFPWWRDIPEGGGPGSVFIQGTAYAGQIRAVVDDPALRDAVFDRLRPTAPRFAGTLVMVTLDP